MIHDVQVMLHGREIDAIVHTDGQHWWVRITARGRVGAALVLHVDNEEQAADLAHAFRRLSAQRYVEATA
jgi:uncharacterized protein with LGFP repeats